MIIINRVKKLYGDSESGLAIIRVIEIPINQCVLVQHGNYFTLYCKMKALSVKAGDKVSIGQDLGTIDTINGQTELHFEVWKGSAPQNPEQWLR